MKIKFDDSILFADRNSNVTLKSKGGIISFSHVNTQTQSVIREGNTNGPTPGSLTAKLHP